MQKVYNLWIHEDQQYKSLVIINPEAFPNYPLYSLLEVIPSTKVQINQQHNKSTNTQRLIVQIYPINTEIIQKQPQLQLSISKRISEPFQLTRTQCSVAQIQPTTILAEFVVFTFSNQYIGRSDMWRLKQSLINSIVYIGQQVEYAECITATIKDIFTRGESVGCGYFSSTTKVIFRSESARFSLFLQMSSEMFEYDDSVDGCMFYEKAVDGFLFELFERWKDIKVNHIVSIVLFTRVLYDECECDDVIDRNERGVLYKDFYRVVIDLESKSDWTRVLPLLKKECLIFNQSVLQQVTTSHSDGSQVVLKGRISNAMDGNILQVVNLSLNPFGRHYVDRDLKRTGQSIVVVTAGTSVYNVDRHLLRLTTERMIDQGVALDLVCLSKPPLHSDPLFIYKAHVPDLSVCGVKEDEFMFNDILLYGEKNSVSFDTSRKEKSGKVMWDPLYYDAPNELNASLKEEVVYAVPFWIDTSFYQIENVKVPSVDVFIPRCRMPGLVDGIVFDGIPTDIIPLLCDELDDSMDAPFDAYNEQVFVSEVALQTRVRGASVAEREGQEEERDMLGSSSNQSSVCTIHSLSSVSTTHYMQTSSPLKSYKQQSVLGNMDVGSYSEKYRTPIYSNERASKSQVELSRSPGAIGMTPSKTSQWNKYTREEQQTRPIDINGRKKSTKNAASLNKSPRSFVDSILAGGKKTKHGNTSVSFQRQNYINPFNPENNIIRENSHLLRWEHIFPRLARLSLEAHTKWLSLCTPACLPLTTDFYPDNETLQEAYNEYAYTVSLSDEQIRTATDMYQLTRNLLKELISFRLAQGFQFIVSVAGHDDIQSLETTTTSRFNFNNVNSFNSSTLENSFYLSLGDEVHILKIDSFAQNVQVKRYVKKSTYKTHHISYNCSIWHKSHKSYTPVSVEFHFSSSILYNWNYLDRMAAGYENEMTESTKYWRSRFILIPINIEKCVIDDRNEEERRIDLFETFLRMILKGRYEWNVEGKDGKRMVEKSVQKALGIQYTTMTMSEFVASEQIQQQILQSNKSEGLEAQVEKVESGLTRDATLIEIAYSVVREVRLEKRRWHWRVYDRICLGSELVDWMVKVFGDINTREEAVEFGEILLTRGLFLHVTRRHGMRDGYYFYQLVDEYYSAAMEKPLPKEPKDQQAKEQSKESKGIVLSRQLTLDVDPLKNTDRRNTATLHYDAIYNPYSCFHFQIHWLTTTAQLIESLVKSWAERAESQLGLKLVEADVDQAQLSTYHINPFLSPVLIKLAVQPPTLKVEQYFQRLLLHLDFILDVEAESSYPIDANRIYSYKRNSYKYAQYIHTTGIAIIQTTENGFLWVTNRIYYSHVGNKSKKVNSDELLERVMKVCGDVEGLEREWESIGRELLESNTGE